MAVIDDVRPLGSELERSYEATLEPAEAREFVVEAWRMVVPKKVSRAYDLTHPDGPG